MGEPFNFFSPAWVDYYLRQARYFFANTHIDHEDASQDAMLKLHTRISSREAALLTDAYVKTAYKNLLRDLYRHHFGRPRVPRWVERLGPIWQRIYELFCFDKIPAGEIAHRLENEGHLHDSQDIPDEIVQRATSRIRAENACPKPRVQPISIDAGLSGEESEPLEIADDVSPESVLSESEIGALMRVIFDHEESNEQSQEELSNQVQAKWSHLRQILELDDDERILLKLIYLENMTMSAAAGVFGDAPDNVRRRIGRICARIRGAFESEGLSFEALME